MILTKHFTLGTLFNKFNKKNHVGHIVKKDGKKSSSRLFRITLPSIPHLEGLDEIIKDLENER